MVASWLVAVALLVLWVLAYGLNLGARWRLRHIPGPRPRWLTGNLTELKAGLYVALPRLSRAYGPIYKVFFGHTPIVVISDPHLLKEVCISKFAVYHDRRYDLAQVNGSHPEVSCPLEVGILAARGKYWAGLRASCERMFHSSQLAQYAPLMNSVATKLASRLAAGGAGPAEEAAAAGVNNGRDRNRTAGAANSINLGAALGSMTLEIIGDSVFGVEFNTDKEGSRIVRESRFIMDPANQPLNSLNGIGTILVPKLRGLWFWLSSLAGGEKLRGGFTARGFVLGTSQALLRNARQQTSAQASNTPGAAPVQAAGAASDDAGSKAPLRTAADAPSATSGMPSKLDNNMALYHQAKEDARKEYGDAVPRDGSLLHHLLRAHNKETGKPFTEVEIMAQSSNFILAGYETTSTALTFAITAIAQHPDIEAKLLAEVDAFPWKGDAGIDFDDIEQFPYTRAVIDETMRMWAPATQLIALQRVATADATVGGYRVDKGDKIWIDVHGIHHDPRHWPEPEVFRPERFLEGSPEAAARHPCAYLPFGVGPRRCIGWRFALEEAVICLVQLYRRARFQLDPRKHPAGWPLEVSSSGATISVKGGAWVVPLPR
jgi:cytochrome P450